MTQAGPGGVKPPGSASILPGAQNTVNNLTTITVPPKVVPQVQIAPPPPAAAEPRRPSAAEPLRRPRRYSYYQPRPRLGR